MKIIYSPRFARLYKKLPGNIKDKAETAEKIFRDNPQDARLHVHKLGGQLAGCWAFSIDNTYRIVFRYGGSKENIYFDLVGNHDIYK